MQVTAHGEHLTKVTRLRVVNAYLVREEDGLTLIDTMFRGSATGLIAAAGRPSVPIVRIVLTHSHMDHAGSVDALVEALPEVELSLEPSRLAPGHGPVIESPVEAMDAALG